MLNYILFWLITGIIAVEFFRRRNNDKYFLTLVFISGPIVIPTLLVADWWWRAVEWLLNNTERGAEILKKIDKFK